jgi:hypothetical protein
MGKGKKTGLLYGIRQKARDKEMTIYIDDGESVKIYPVKIKVAKAVMTLLELDDEWVWSKTHTGYGVTIVDKAESEG